MQKTWIYLARHRLRGRSESRVETIRTPLSFCFTHSRVKSKGGRTERGRGGGRTREERRRTRRRDSPESTRPPPWSPRIVEFAFGEEVPLPHLASPRSLQRSLLFCILHWRWDLVVRFADAPPFRPSSHRTRGIVLLLQERSDTSHVLRGWLSTYC